MAIPVQEFQIGQRVRPDNGQPAFTIDMIYAGIIEKGLVYCGSGFSGRASQLTLAPERPPYVPSERRIVDREPGRPAIHSHLTALYRCETDDEMAARHAVERTEYDCPCPADPVIYNARGESIGITGRTSLDVPGAA